MKTKTPTRSEYYGAAKTKRPSRSLTSRKIATQVEAAKAMIFAESQASSKLNENMLRLALNEAEALAWQTVYPHLLFPTLAIEKVQTMRAWRDHQKQVRAQDITLALAE